jgi:hypothetical protein
MSGMISHHVMVHLKSTVSVQAYGWSGGNIQSFLSATLDESEWSASRPSPFIIGENAPPYPLILETTLKLLFMVYILQLANPYSSVIIVTEELDGRGFIAARSTQIFSSLPPDGLRGSPNFLFNVYWRIFSLGQSGRGTNLTSQFQLVTSKRLTSTSVTPRCLLWRLQGPPKNMYPAVKNVFWKTSTQKSYV